MGPWPVFVLITFHRIGSSWKIVEFDGTQARAHQVELVLGEGEERDPEVAEDEVFGQKVERLKKLLRSLLRFDWKIPEMIRLYNF